ncbi:MAG: NAD-binding protein [Dehalococcoidia bacterium]|jgi:trk system potassium uptake protein TrkA|nr:NAD-binding protein [Dehalococcoidia bacterium]|tara:strand:+ start:936 stop:1331 length:396 start_codon:yes stop_codon:yes gene_type:complete
MNIVIMGCNGIAVNVAEKMAKNDHKITIIDVQADNFLIIEETENITTIIGDGTISNELEGAGIIESDIFLALEPSDNRNILAAQKVKSLYNPKTILCLVSDPKKDGIFRKLGLNVISTTSLISDIVLDSIR